MTKPTKLIKPDSATKKSKTASKITIAKNQRSKSAGPKRAVSSSKRESDTIIYQKDSFVVFVNGTDTSDDLKRDQFCIGLVSFL